MKGEASIHRRVLDYAYMETDALYQDFHISAQGYCDEEAAKAVRAMEKMFCQDGQRIRCAIACAELSSLRLPSYYLCWQAFPL